MKATSFATRQDLAKFAAAVTRGKTVEQAFAVGDNGVGAWGDPTWMPEGPAICALPRPWGRNQKVRVTIHQLNKSVVCLVRDRAPAGVVDLNPAALKEFGLNPDADVEYDNVEVIEA